MSIASSLADTFVRVLRDPEGPAWQEAAGAMFGAVKRADPIDRDEALRIVASALDIDQPLRAGYAAVVGGGIVEAGGAASILARQIMTYLPEVLRCASRMVERTGPVEGIGEENTREADAFASLETWCLPMIACLSLSADLRREAAGTNLLDLVSPLAGADDSAGFLKQMLCVLDDEPLIVLDVKSLAGFECRISGISSNFQLHTLLSDSLIRNPAIPSVKPSIFSKLFGKRPESPAETPSETWLTGERPSAAVVAVARGTGPQQIAESSHGVWNVYNWQALSRDGALPDSMEKPDTWVWNEGCPADVEKFEGVRTVLLGPPIYKRSWNTSRDFNGMKASLKVERVLTAQQVKDRLHRIAAAPH